jgi:hypothetical protein
MTIKTRFGIKCPYCRSERSVTIYESVPRNKIDCRCGSVAEVRFIANVTQGKVWSVEWASNQGEPI